MSFGELVHRLASVGSTNDEARRLAQAGTPHGTVVVAEEQTGGRGTRGRTWHSPPGLGLYASFVLRAPAGRPFPLLHLVPLAAGLAAAEAVAEVSGRTVRLKWPNDLILEGKKLGGVLCEGVTGEPAGDYVVVGLGINIGHGPEDFPPSLRGTAISLSQAGAHLGSKGALLAALCRALEAWYNALVRGEGSAVIKAFEEKMAFPVGTGLRLDTDQGPVAGTFRGLDERGRLLLEIAGAERPVPFDSVRGLDRT